MQDYGEKRGFVNRLKSNETQSARDAFWMKKAIKMARAAGKRGEVPVAAIVVSPDNQEVSKASNLKENLRTPIAHAEIIALHRAAKKLGRWRLEDCTLYVTLEPCPMCAGALVQARIGRLVFGAHDPKAGAAGSVFSITSSNMLNHQIPQTAGVLGTDCGQVLSEFFSTKRIQAKEEKDELVRTAEERVRSSVVVIHKDKLLGFHAIDPFNQQKYFFLPGGKIEENESAQESAVRECLEETGYRIQILQNSSLKKDYYFTWNGKLNLCRTEFFLARLDEDFRSPGKVMDASYNLGADWISINQIPDYFSYNQTILAAIQKLIKKRHLL